METLIPRDYWLQDLLHPGELEAWDPEAGPCCTAAAFKLNFNGTPHDDWNVSASRVFADHFFMTYPDLYENNWDNRELILKKTQAHIKTLLRSYRKQFVSDDVARQTRIAHRRRERKTVVSVFRCC